MYGRRFRVVIVSMLISLLTLDQALAQAKSYEQLNAQLQALYNADRYREILPILPEYEAAAIAKFGADGAGHIEALQNIAGIHSLLGRFADAERYNRAALALVERRAKPYDRKIADITSDLGTLYARQERYTEAEAAFRRSIEIDAKTRPKDDPTGLATIANLANVLSGQARYGDAEDLLRSAIVLADKPSKNSQASLALLLHALSSIYQHQGRYRESAPLLVREIAILESLPRIPQTDLTTALNNLALTQVEMGENAEAEQLLLKVRQRDVQIFGPTSWQTGVSFLNLGNVERNLGKTADAEQSFKHAAAIAEQRLGANSVQLANALNNIGDLYERTGRARDALAYLKRALAIYEEAQGPLSAPVVRNLHGLARATASSGDPEASLAFARDAARRVIERAKAVGNARNRGLAASPIAQQRFVLDDAIERLAAAAASRPRDAESAGREAFVLAQWPTQSSAGTAIQQMAQRFSEGDGALASAVREAQDLDGRWLATEERFKAALEQPGNGRPAAELAPLKSELAEIERKQAALADRLTREFPQYSALTQPAPLPVEDVQRQLGPREAMVVVYSTPTLTAVWAVGPHSFAWHAAKLPRADLAQKVTALRAGLEAIPNQPNAAVFDPQAAFDVYKLLLAPVGAVIDKAEHLIVVASGPVTSLPLHVLVTQPPPIADYGTDIVRYRDVAWLAARQATSLLPTVSSLKSIRALAAVAQAPLPLIGFANPALEQTQTAAGDPGAERRRGKAPAGRTAAVATSRTTLPVSAARRRDAGSYHTYFRGLDTNVAALRRAFAPLPETEVELRAVGERVGAGPGTLKLGAEASEATVKSLDLAQYRIVYFATHGLVAGEIDGFGEPSLVLSLPTAPTALDDGLLTASEVARLKLHADWVVLSACNTAAGSKPGAEALSGLARAFIYAGARAMLVTHWSVETNAAVALTTATFAELERDPATGRAEALRRAMLALMRKSPNPLDAHPGSWAPFVVVGEGQR